MRNLYLMIKKCFNRKERRNNTMAIIDVLNNLLYIKEKQVPFIECDVEKFNKGKNTCEFIVLHYTGSASAKSAHNTYQDPKAKVSWHLTIDRDGKVHQLLPFDKRAWHAGTSSWGDGLVKNLNKCSIGIEMSNAGPLKEENGSYVTWYGQVIPGVDVFFDEDGNPWQKYHPEQLKAAAFLTLALGKIFKVKDILSHEMISPGRKRDTGPAFQETLDYIRKTYKNG